MSKYIGRMFILGAFAMLIGAFAWLVMGKDLGPWTMLVGTVLTAVGAKDVVMTAIYRRAANGANGNNNDTETGVR